MIVYVIQMNLRATGGETLLREPENDDQHLLFRLVFFINKDIPKTTSGPHAII